MKTFESFYKESGIKTSTAFSSPTPTIIRQLPRASILHFPSDGVSEFPDVANHFIANLKDKVVLYNEMELLEGNKSVSRTNAQKQEKIRRWINENRKQFITTIKPVSTITNENQIAAVNYGLASVGYKYSESNKLASYWKYRDVSLAMWERIKYLSETSNRHQFILLKMADGIPSRSTMNAASKEFTSVHSFLYDSVEKLNYLEFWKFIDPVLRADDPDVRQMTQDHSVMGKVQSQNYPKINFIFQLFDGTSVVLNMGYLNSWIRGQPIQTLNGSVSQSEPSEVQMKFLKFLLTLQNYNIEGQKSVSDFMEHNLDNDDTDEGYEEDYTTPNYNESGNNEEDDEGSGPHSAQTSELSEMLSQLANADKREKIEDKEIDNSDLDALEELEQKRMKELQDELEEQDFYDPEEGLPIEELEAKVNNHKAFGQTCKEMLDKLVEKKSITAIEYKRSLKAIEDFKSVPDPFGSGKSLLEASIVSKEDLQFNEKENKMVDPLGVCHESMTYSPVEAINRDYVRNVFKKEMLAVLASQFDMGIIISDLEIKEVSTSEGDMIDLSYTAKPIGGKPSRLRHRTPMPKEDGTFKAKGVRYHHRTQINDVNERKIHGNQVSLGTSTAKMFITRSEAKANDRMAHVSKHLNRAQLGEVEGINRVRRANVYDMDFKCPYIYSLLSEEYKGFDVEHQVFGKLSFDFESKKRDSILTPEARSAIEKNGRILVGSTASGQPLFVDEDNIFFVATKNGDEPIGNIYTVLGMDESKIPVGFAEISVLGKSMPVGLLMGRQLGFRNLLKLSKVPYRMVEGKTAKLEVNEFRVRFKDRSFIFSKDDRLASLIFGGFEKHDGYTKNYNAKMFDDREVYDTILEYLDMTQMHIREIDNLERGFIDPISRRRLAARGSPVTFMGLLLKGCNELTHNNTPATQDADSQQLLGYERFSGAMYREIYKANRLFRNQNATGRSKINMSHFAVWQSIMDDATIKTCEDINPIQNLKMHEALTYAGEGGRSRETFNLPARAMNLKSVGLISEASVDSGDVAYNVFMSWNPTLMDLNGTRKPTENLTFGNILSTSLNLVAEPNRNDMKRNVFTAIQSTHTLQDIGTTVPRVQTGIEALVGQRTDDLFCTTAKDQCKVIQITEKGIIVQYKDGTKRGVELGRRYGDAEGTTYPHDLVTDLKVGDVVNKGETIAYNTGFFEPSKINPKFSMLKFTGYTNVAYMELPEIHEDSVVISEELAESLVTHTVDPRSYVVRFTQNLHDVIKPGTEVDPDSVLMVIENEITSGVGVFDAKSTTTLGRLGRDAPRAGHTGVMDSIECYYHGDKGDMSPSVRKLVDASDRAKADISKSTGTPVPSGKVSSDWSVAGKPLQLDHVEIIFNVTMRKGMGNGDKMVLGEQLKATVGRVDPRRIVTESGRKVDALFCGRAVIKRIVTAVINNGSAMVLAEAAEKEAVKAFFG